MPDQPTITAYVALGSNLGQREKTIQSAIDLLKQSPGIRVLKVSRLVETKAVGGPSDSPDYLNGAVEIQTTLSASALLQRLLDIERQLGRVRKEKWEPRLIDLDILLYGQQVISTPQLRVPHPLMHERAFVLEPLCDLRAEIVHPILRKTVRQLFEALSQ